MTSLPSSKLASFEWVLEFSDFRSALSLELISYWENVSQQCSRALVVGSGTSSLSENLADFGFSSVVSVDNDGNCIQYMAEQYKSDDRLKWIVYDVIENSCLQDTISMSELSDESFDVIVDKATIDALLTQGPISSMLFDIHRMLKLNGLYVICSAHSADLLLPLLSIPELEYSLSSHYIERLAPNAITPTSGTIVFCKKTSPTNIDKAELARSERAVMDIYFCDVKPLLTKERDAELRQIFESSESDSLSLEDAYAAMFRDADMLNYDKSFFMEDLVDFPLQREGRMTVLEALQFLRKNQ